jgi:hypothetical protein
MSTLGKLYARCKAAGGKSRGFGLTSVSSDPALSTMSSSSSSLRRKHSRLRTGRIPTDVLSGKKPFILPSIKSGSSDRLLEDDEDSKSDQEALALKYVLRSISVDELFSSLKLHMKIE